jgi:hypothetical protein
MPLVDWPHSVLWRKVKVGEQFIHTLAERLLGKPMPFGDLFHAFFRPPD